MQKQKTILIAGAGFGGVTAAIALTNKLKDGRSNIIIVDRNDYHLYHPNLYEAAATEEEFVSPLELKKSIAVPLREILPKQVKFIKGEINSIDHQNKFLVCNDEKIPFDYLLVAMGSTSDYFGIPGLKENSLTLKSLPDALMIRNACESVVQAHRLDITKKFVRIVVGGGGFTGCELAGELINLVRILQWKYNYPPAKIELMVIEGMNQVLPGLNPKISKAIYDRLRSFGVEIRLNNLISKVDGRQIFINNGEVINYDVLVWTGGVRGVKLPFAVAPAMDNKDRLLTGKNLMANGSDCVFALGDCANVSDAQKRPLPQTAQQALYEGKYVAECIAALLNNGQLPEFRPKQFSYIVSVKGKWAAWLTPGGTMVTGFFAWLAHRFGDLDYFMLLMPWYKAALLTWFDTKMYTRND